MSTNEEYLAFVAVFGDPEEWEHYQVQYGVGYIMELYRCPQCSAFVFNPYQHRDWHLAIGA